MQACEYSLTTRLSRPGGASLELAILQ